MKRERERETKQMKYALFADKLTRVFEKESRGKRAHSPWFVAGDKHSK